MIAPPIPIEDIVEKHLKLGFEFDDMHQLFGVPRSGLGFEPDILGAIFFDERRIVIDESLDPEENPSMEGRYRFTLAHEGGGIGGCTVTCSPRTRRRSRCSTSRPRPRLFAGRARRKNPSSGRRISMRRAC